MKLLAQTKKTQAELLAERTAPIRRELRALKKDKPRLAAEIARAEAERAGKLIALPRPTETYSTAALEAAADALAGKAKSAEALSPAAQVDRITLVPQPVLAVLPETRHQRFARARELEEQEKAGISLSIGEARWLAGYRAGAEYRAMVDDEGIRGAIREKVKPLSWNLRGFGFRRRLSTTAPQRSRK